MKASLSEYGFGPQKKNAQKKRPPANAEPPSAPESEQGVLSCVMQGPLAMSECEEAGLAAEWFADLPHQVIFDCLKQLAAAGATPDLIAVQQWLRDAGTLEQIGGISYLSFLQGVAPSAEQLPVYLDLVREKWLARSLLKVCDDGRAGAFDKDLPAAIAAVERGILALSENHASQVEQSVKEILPAVIDELEHYHRGAAQIRGLETGLRYVDKMLCGIGGEDNNFVVIGGRPGTGKTSLALDVVLHVSLDHIRPVQVDCETAKQLEVDGEPISVTKEEKFYHLQRGFPVAIFSLEMTKKALVKRMAFQRAQADAQRWRTGFADGSDLPPLQKAMGELSGAKIFIDDSGRCTIDELKARARRLHRQHGIKLFVIDYIQLLRSAGKRGREDRVQELADISGELQSLGKELKCPFLILAQMNRDYEKEPNREPRLSDLKDCGAIEQDADIVAFLHTPKKADEDEQYVAAMAAVYGSNEWSKYPKPVDLLIAKARNGPTGPCHLLFQKSSMHFHDRQQWMEKHAGYKPAAGEKKEQMTMPTNEEMGLG